MRAPELMRQQNRASILATIQEHGPISRVELAQMLDLNPATVTRITRTLLEEGLIHEIGEGTSQNAGRKPVLLEFNHRSRLLIGVVILPGGVTGVVADLAGTILTRRTILPPAHLTFESILPLFEDLLEADPNYQPRLTAACIGMWAQDDALAEALSSTLCIPVFTAEIARLAALGEAAWGAAQGQQEFALFYLGSHSSACLYFDGQTRAGGLGLSPEGESLSSRLCDASLISLTQQALAEGEASALRNHTRLSANMVFEAARQHDVLAQQVVNQIADDLAWSVAWWVDALGLEYIILGGSWHHAADVLIPAVYRQVRSFKLPALIPTGVGDDAPILGTIRLMLDQINLTV